MSPDFLDIFSVKSFLARLRSPTLDTRGEVLFFEGRANSRLLYTFINYISEAELESLRSIDFL